MNVERDSSRPVDICPPDAVPSSCWALQLPQELIWNKDTTGFLIHDDYIVVLEHLFTAVGWDFS